MIESSFNATAHTLLERLAKLPPYSQASNVLKVFIVFYQLLDHDVVRVSKYRVLPTGFPGSVKAYRSVAGLEDHLHEPIKGSGPSTVTIDRMLWLNSGTILDKSVYLIKGGGECWHPSAIRLSTLLNSGGGDLRLFDEPSVSSWLRSGRSRPSRIYVRKSAMDQAVGTLESIPWN